MVRVMDLLEGVKISLCYQRRLKKVQERASLNPENLFIQVRLGDLLAKLKKKKEAVAVYELAGQQFVQKNLFAQAIALQKIIFRLEPPKDDGEQMNILNRLYERMNVYRQNTSEAEEAAPRQPESPRPRPSEKGREGLRLQPKAIPQPVV
jgi:hypothetical protein